MEIKKLEGNARLEIINLAKLSVQYGINGNFSQRDYYAEQIISLIGNNINNNLCIKEPNSKWARVHTESGKKTTAFWKCINNWSKLPAWGKLV